VEDDHIRRSVYVQVELARMDFEEEPENSKFLHQFSHATQTEVLELKRSETGVRILLLLGRFDELRNQLSLAPSLKKDSARKNKFKILFHNILTFLFLLFSLPPMFITLPLRLFHPLLRKFGFQNNYLLIDMIQ